MMNKENKLSPVARLERVKVAASFMWAFAGTLLITSSVVQASDMQIYAVPTAGKKTIVMMLDTSGSMGNNDTGQTGTRLARLKAGMNAFLDSNNVTLPDVKVGLGHYSVNGDGRSARILVAAETLGPVGSAQRALLKQAVAGLTASGNTPTSHAYAEAAAYLMGTSTRSESEIEKDIYKKVTSSITEQVCLQSPYLTKRPSYSACYRSSNYNTNDWINPTTRTTNTDTYYQCKIWRATDFYSGVQYCANTNSNRSGTSSNYWINLGSNQPADLFQDGENVVVSGNPIHTIYYKLEMQLGTNADSGFENSIESVRSGNNYISPLSPVADIVSCDGQGVYVLSDGEANGSSAARSTSIMSAALQTSTSNFTCPSTGGLDTAAAASWNCMGEFAKKLYNNSHCV
ncbi:MAG: VWA domain-containing protein [Moraxellaceae bacterium]|nr:MAG: VWA domain-containing protein [Moraxellaceae bacterium]